jgi:hypothetical protein
VLEENPNHEQPCWLCNTPAHAFNFECPECRRRWDEIECRELRERLFGPPTTPEAVTR